MNQSETSRNSSRQNCYLWGKGYFAALGTWEKVGSDWPVVKDFREISLHFFSTGTLVSNLN